VRAWTLLSIAGCGFHPTTTANGDVGSGFYSDAHLDDGGMCFGTKDIICLAMEPSGTLILPTTTPLSTDTDCTEVVLGQCVVAAQDIDVTGMLIAIGTRPLVLIAVNTIMIDGSVDVSSKTAPPRIGASANDASCSTANAGASDSGGGGGGAGGSFTTIGAAGGVGDLNMNHPPNGSAPGGMATVPTIVSHLRGGCPAGRGGEGDDPSTDLGLSPGGPGGASGGAVRLIANTQIVVGGAIYASGAGGGTTMGNSGSCATNNGGYEQGGGGGGTGGMIWLDAPSVMVAGTIAANGGGGAGGGGCYGGSPGTDGTTSSWNARASGGTGETADSGGDGGAGAAAGLAALTGSSADSGAGGGGGSEGIVWIDGSLVGGAMISPAPAAH
jgi:hypothetical protein